MRNKLVKYFSPVYLAQGITNSEEFKRLKELFGQDPSTPAGAENLGQLITSVVQVLLLVAASVAVIFLLYGGYQYVISRSNEEAAEDAKKTIKSAIIGLIIILLSMAIVSLVANVVLRGAPGTGV